MLLKFIGICGIIDFTFLWNVKCTHVNANKLLPNKIIPGRGVIPSES